MGTHSIGGVNKGNKVGTLENLVKQNPSIAPIIKIADSFTPKEVGIISRLLGIQPDDYVESKVVSWVNNGRGKLVVSFDLTARSHLRKEIDFRYFLSGRGVPVTRETRIYSGAENRWVYDLNQRIIGEFYTP